MKYVNFVFNFVSLCVNFSFVNFILHITDTAEAISKIEWSRNHWWIKEKHLLDCKCWSFRKKKKSATDFCFSFNNFISPLNFVFSLEILVHLNIYFLPVGYLSFQDKQLKSESGQRTGSAILAEHKKKEREAAKKGKQPFYLSKSTVILLHLHLSLSLSLSAFVYGSWKYV